MIVKKKSLPKTLERAQRIFNEFIRLRDKDKPCISCGVYHKIEQASHFYSVGQYSALRFNEDNVHGSCLVSNYFRHGDLHNYRRHLIQRIGESRVNLLDSIATRHRVKKWTVGEVELIIEEYKQKVKALK